MELSQNADEGERKTYYPRVDRKKSEPSENEIKGNMAEESFANFLNDKNIPYFYIDQSWKTFSKVFDINHLKRPDYIIYTEKGVFHIDVKCRKKYSLGSTGEERFYLNQNEIEKLFNFDNKLHSNTWIAFTDEKATDFFYAPIQKIYDYSMFIINGMKKRLSKKGDIKEEEIEKTGIYSNDICFIHIPESFLYNRLSFEKSFFKEPNYDFSEADVGYHIGEAIGSLMRESYRDYKKNG